MRLLATYSLLAGSFVLVLLAIGTAGWMGLARRQLALTAPRPAAPAPRPTTDPTADPPAHSAGESPIAKGSNDGKVPRPPLIAPAPMPLPPPPPLPDAGPVELAVLRAITHGRQIRVEAGLDGYAVTEWRDPRAFVSWEMPPIEPGWYAVQVSFACAQGAGGDYTVAVAQQRVSGHARFTGGGDVYRTDRIGAVHVTSGQQQLLLTPQGQFANSLMNLRGVCLVPEK